MAVLLGLAAAAGVATPSLAIDWQPALAWVQPWRSVTAAAVHYSRLHLLANLAGLGVVALLGVAARLPGRSALAWALAWPLTHLGLVLRPDLGHAGGLSGVLHAGVAVVVVQLLGAGSSRRRLIGGALATGLLLKVVGEAPWNAALRYPAGWDIAVAPAMHASGLVAGVACALAVEGWSAWRRRSRSRSATRLEP